MALLRQCCCWNNVRSGSLASGIYTLVFAMICIAIDLYNAICYQQEGVVYTYQVIEVVFYVMLSMYIFIAVLSVIVIVGVHKDNANMLLPWIHGLILFMLVELACTIYIFVEAGMSSMYWFSLFELVFYVGRTVLNIYCVLCVVSQYQELKAGRGRLEDMRRPIQHIVVYQAGISGMVGTNIPPSGPVIIQPLRADFQSMTGSTFLQNFAASPMMAEPPPYSAPNVAAPAYQANPMPAEIVRTRSAATLTPQRPPRLTLRKQLAEP